MFTIQQRIEALRSEMKSCGCSAYIMPSSDPHASEYAPAHYTSWEYFSGFKCENANLVVTENDAALWIDGRFFGAADAALEGTGIRSMHMGVKGVPTVSAWIREQLKSGDALGYTAANMCLSQLRTLSGELEEAGISMLQSDCDDRAWTEDRPALPASTAWILNSEYAGLTICEKLERFRSECKDCDAAIVTKLDSIAWLLNLRADDVENTPYALAFCVVTKNGAVLFIDESRVPADVSADFKVEGVEIKPYSDVTAYVAAISEKTAVLVDPASVNAALYNAVCANPNCTVVEKKDPIQLLKAVKNGCELSNTKEAHLVDAVAMVRFQMELEKRLANGEALRETDIDVILHKYRSSAERFIEESFGTIAAYGANAAMMHYAPVAGSDAAIEPHGFLLVDCGGTYYDGTTDITRTYTVGPMTELEKEMYTLTLKSHIDIAKAVWREGMKGGQLDMIARQPFWSKMLDYRCGTGHSVSHVGAVHEGPHSLRYTNEVEFVPGMIITDEPGYYEEGVVGIRIENELVCVEAGESEYGRFLKFDPITFVPINTQPVIIGMLDSSELAWLNEYHSAVYEKLSPRLNEAECEWLRAACAAIG